MSDPIHDQGGAASLEGHTTHELQRDEDVLSADLRDALESVGSGVGFIAALALICSQMPRAGRLLGKVRATSATAATPTPSAEAIDHE